MAVDAIIHELGHLVEEYIEAAEINALLKRGYIPHLSQFTHDSVGTFASSMKYFFSPFWGTTIFVFKISLSSFLCKIFSGKNILEIFIFLYFWIIKLSKTSILVAMALVLTAGFVQAQETDVLFSFEKRLLSFLV